MLRIRDHIDPDDPIGGDVDEVDRPYLLAVRQVRGGRYPVDQHALGQVSAAREHPGDGIGPADLLGEQGRPVPFSRPRGLDRGRIAAQLDLRIQQLQEPRYLVSTPMDGVWSLGRVWLCCPAINGPGGVAARSGDTR